MPKINKLTFPTQFPMNVHHTFSGLATRGLMTPSYLSRWVMRAVLPAKFNVTKERPLRNDETGFCTKDSVIDRLTDRASCADNVLKWLYQLLEEITKTHTLKAVDVNGLETLEAKQTTSDKNPPYEIFFCDNGQDAMGLFTVHARIEADPKKNYIFWNYPGVGSSRGPSHATHHLFEAGYQQAKRLIESGIPAEKITLHGLSLGGGVAAHVARQLHEEGHFVNLEVDRSFSRLASVIPARLEKGMINNRTSKQSPYAPLMTSTIAFALSGVSLGMTFAGFVASIGLVTASTVTAVGYMGALCIETVGFLLESIMQVIGKIIAFPFSFFSKPISDNIEHFFNRMGWMLAFPFNLTAAAINKIFSTLASFIDSAINLIGSIVCGAIAVGGLIAGSIVGLIFGSLLSVQLLWTDKPLTLPMTPAFSAALYSSCCEMNSVGEVHRLLKADEKAPEGTPKPRICVMDDEVIDVDASLNTRLGLQPNTASDLSKKITSFWYRNGGHAGDRLSELVTPAVNP